MESSWKGRVKSIHLEEEFAEVDEAAEALYIAVSPFELVEISYISHHIAWLLHRHDMISYKIFQLVGDTILDDVKPFW